MNLRHVVMVILGGVLLLSGYEGVGVSRLNAAGAKDGGTGLKMAHPTAKILKVLPQFLDQEGRHSLSPSLFERDAYQAQLRKNRKECSALRFAVQWRAAGSLKNLRLQIEARTGSRPDGKVLKLQEAIRPAAWGSRWDHLSLSGPEFEQAGDIVAWRATLWEGDALLAEQKSFLW